MQLKKASTPPAVPNNDTESSMKFIVTPIKPGPHRDPPNVTHCMLCSEHPAECL